MDNNEPSSSSASNTTKGDASSDVVDGNETDSVNIGNELSSGGYSYEFVDSLVKEMKELECPICCLLMKDAQELGCHHAMCLSCLNKWEKENIEKKSSFTCPQCCVEIAKEKTVPNGIINRLISTSIKVKCENSGKGCEWIGVICDIVFHIKNKCDFTIVKCLNERCTEKVQRRRVDAHVERCLYRIINCSFCSCELTFADQNDHFNGCEFAPVECGNKGCFVMLSRNKISLHLQDCDFKTIKCQFELIGCKIEIPPKEMEEHMILSTTSHMNLMLLEMKKGKTELSATKEDLRETKEKLEKVTIEYNQQRNLLDEIIINDIDIFIKKSQYFQDMERSVNVMENNFIAVNDEVKNRIRKFDLELKVTNECELKDLNNSNNCSINSHNSKIQNLVHNSDDQIIVFNEFRDIFQKYGAPFTAVEHKLIKEKTSDYCRKLIERANKCFITDWKETTYSERIAAIMEHLPENSMMMHNDRAVLKLQYSAFDSSWELIIRRSEFFCSRACKIDLEKETVEVGLPRFFYSAGVCELFRRFSLPLEFKRKRKDQQYFTFDDFEHLALYLSNGFILIELFDEKWEY